jgi:hypothetical protein
VPPGEPHVVGGGSRPAAGDTCTEDLGVYKFEGSTRDLSVFGPWRSLSRQVNLCCVFPNPDGDAKRIHGVLSWFGQRRPYV